MDDLREKYTVIIVTHNMQQAARIADKTAFFLTGEIVEYTDTQTMFNNPKTKEPNVTLPAVLVNFVLCYGNVYKSIEKC